MKFRSIALLSALIIISLTAYAVPLPKDTNDLLKQIDNDLLTLATSGRAPLLESRVTKFQKLPSPKVAGMNTSFVHDLADIRIRLHEILTTLPVNYIKWKLPMAILSKSAIDIIDTINQQPLGGDSAALLRIRQTLIDRTIKFAKTNPAKPLLPIDINELVLKDELAKTANGVLRLSIKPNTNEINIRMIAFRSLSTREAMTFRLIKQPFLLIAHNRNALTLPWVQFMGENELLHLKLPKSVSVTINNAEMETSLPIWVSEYLPNPSISNNHAFVLVDLVRRQKLGDFMESNQIARLIKQFPHKLKTTKKIE
jgi:hypothetical protein